LQKVRRRNLTDHKISSDHIDGTYTLNLYIDTARATRLFGRGRRLGFWHEANVPLVPANDCFGE
jgi:hypothetical protein